ncbi:hypothetical protein BOX15_Mlig028271g1 [Macrostomum lignano]|uniref:Uncharacterized protein n=2 Tax=Macrostomum lignano TaxID=282301 RepID=A0A267H0N2_9PLAT|nr:hypothetical protein BOX15_Mlig028271g1 [Macrostomum lignano]
MEDLRSNILAYIDKHETCSSTELCKEMNVEHQKIVGALNSILAFGEIISAQPEVTSRLELTDEGRQVADHGSHEAVLFASVPAGDGAPQSELMKSVPNAKIGFSKALANRWIRLDKSAQGGPRVYRQVESVSDRIRHCLQMVAALSLDSLTAEERAELKKRKLVQEGRVTVYRVAKGPAFTLTLAKEETELTAEMLATGVWQTLTFKAYNFKALGQQPDCGHLHPLLKVRAEFRQIFLEMGFQEMPTNRYVESSFWNFDALFQPQQHPARDAHDTFFLTEPAACRLDAEQADGYLARVKAVHSNGGYGSIGYNYDWKESEAQKNILRTHTTAVSARMLYQLAQQPQFQPTKYFSIDRVFRNESLDATHLAEFHQIEGLVADYNLNLCHLMGIIREFFHKLGIRRLRFKPAYNPYTEPSMEIFSYHEGLGKWVEIGNSGVFRPEMLLPMGLPESVSVIAWGLSLERPTMIKYGINNIRDLIGPKVDLKMVSVGPICRLDK